VLRVADPVPLGLVLSLRAVAASAGARGEDDEGYVQRTL
jgi:hypothetical protein